MRSRTWNANPKVILGTEWTAPGQGERLDVLLAAFGKPANDDDEIFRTNLRLTGALLTAYDYDRLRNLGN